MKAPETPVDPATRSPGVAGGSAGNAAAAPSPGAACLNGVGAFRVTIEQHTESMLTISLPLDVAKRVAAMLSRTVHPAGPGRGAIILGDVRALDKVKSKKRLYGVEVDDAVVIAEIGKRSAWVLSTKGLEGRAAYPALLAVGDSKELFAPTDLLKRLNNDYGRFLRTKPVITIRPWRPGVIKPLKERGRALEPATVVYLYWRRYVILTKTRAIVVDIDPMLEEDAFGESARVIIEYKDTQTLVADIPLAWADELEKAGLKLMVLSRDERGRARVAIPCDYTEHVFRSPKKRETMIGIRYLATLPFLREGLTFTRLLLLSKKYATAFEIDVEEWKLRGRAYIEQLRVTRKNGDWRTIGEIHRRPYQEVIIPADVKPSASPVKVFMRTRSAIE